MKLAKPVADCKGVLEVYLMKESNAFIFTLALLLIVFDGSKQCFAQITDETADHSQPDPFLLKKHVRANGLVDYKGFISDQKDLNEYIRYLSNNPHGFLVRC